MNLGVPDIYRIYVRAAPPARARVSLRAQVLALAPHEGRWRSLRRTIARTAPAVVEADLPDDLGRASGLPHRAGRHLRSDQHQRLVATQPLVELYGGCMVVLKVP